MARLRGSLIGFTASSLLVGCNSAAPSPESDVVARDSVVVSDSAVIRIVESTEPAFSDAAFWRLSEEPELEIGLQDGPEEYLFGHIADAVRLADGRLVVLDAMSSEIRFFSPTGDFLTQTGGQGLGPGEYSWATRITIGRGDSLYVLDTGLPRVTVIDSNGALLRTYTFRFGSKAPPSGRHAVLEDGSVLMFARGHGWTQDNAHGFIRDTTQYYLWSASAEYVGPLASLTGPTRWSRPELGHFLAYTPFGPGFWKSAGLGNKALLGNGFEPEIQVWGPDATLETIVRWKAPIRPVTDELRKQYEIYRLEEWPASRRAGLRTWLGEVPYPASLPTYQSFLSDDEGNVWVQEYHVPWEPGNRWTVLSREFQWLGSVTVPEGFVIKHVANGKVTGVHRDDMGVARARVYALIRVERIP